MRSLLINELDVDPARVPAVLHYDGTPITARFIVAAIRKAIAAQAAKSSRTPTAEQVTA
jgi:2-oxoglutarate ferredoxin oxidoreductase subunit alpha